MKAINKIFTNAFSVLDRVLAHAQVENKQLLNSFTIASTHTNLVQFNLNNFSTYNWDKDKLTGMP